MVLNNNNINPELVYNTIKAEMGTNPTPTFWADKAYQLHSESRQGAYDRVMGKEEGKREAEFLALVLEVSVGGKGPTYWADAAYQVNPNNTGMTR
jgi:hypothetical protein